MRRQHKLPRYNGRAAIVIQSFFGYMRYGIVGELYHENISFIVCRRH